MKPPKQTDLMKSPRSVREWCMWASLEMAHLDAELQRLRDGLRSLYEDAAPEGKTVTSKWVMACCRETLIGGETWSVSEKADLRAEVKLLRKEFMDLRDHAIAYNYDYVCKVCDHALGEN